ncbi:MAG: alanine--tRNA ligase [Fimbriimonadia bacterium]|nr:alanine--tRNA ligase [Fimbriimonadia bacterium]
MSQWNARDLRKAYLEFFQEKDHLWMPSDSLVPKDPSLLFTSAGMVQFKPFFSGTAQPPQPRATTAQKCMRTTDIDTTGDLSHLTFFEMLGNFSFGDYFKREAVHWAWEFLTERLKLDASRLQFTVYEDDDEAFDLWHKEIGIPKERIWRLDATHNYWPANAIIEGPNGPCGPCSEIYYDTRLSLDCPNPECGPACDCNRWLEIWNLVFMQFERSEENGAPKLTPLPKQNIDTGMGLERTSAVLMGFGSVYDTDVFTPIIRRIEALSGAKYGDNEQTDTAIRIIADHIRTSTFCISDGVIPQNEGRGYVLRRVIRRAVLKGLRELKFDQPFFAEVVPAVVEAMGDFYPDLSERQNYIQNTLRYEEERFRQTVAQGIHRLEEMLATPETHSTQVLEGERAFMLYDTFGFPLELTQEVASEHGIQVDLEGFEKAMEAQRQRAREASGIAEKLFTQSGSALAELARSAEKTRFVGYAALEGEGRVVGILKQGELVPSASHGDQVELVLDVTPFYAESGGQVGDAGVFENEKTRVRISDTQKTNDFYLHAAHIESGSIALGDTLYGRVDTARRRDIMRNHTATHLLHAALRQTLGEHVAQAGSLVAPDRLRFDFTHPKALTPEEISAIEQIVNEKILEEREVNIYQDVSLEEARQRGAMMLFGEKYGERVRMVEIPGFSLELCGGTHLKNTIETGLFKLVGEGSVSAGVRRVEALTGAALYRWLQEREQTLQTTAHLLNTPAHELPSAVERLRQQVKEAQAEIARLKQAQASQAGSDIEPKEVGGLMVVAQAVDDLDGKSLGSLADQLIQKGNHIVALGSAQGERVVLVVKVSPEGVQKGAHAGNLIRAIAQQVGGSGGGRPDFAQAGGKDPSKLKDALALAFEWHSL